MPRNYKRTSNRQSWSPQAMQKAIEAVQEKKMGWLLASKTFKVPQATLRRHALKQNKRIPPAAKGLGRFQVTFPLQIERELVEHIKLLETRMFGLTRTMVQELAFELAEKNGFVHSFNKEKGKAGQEWLDGFLRRHKDISLRKPEPTSAARAQAFNRPQVKKFFDNYQEHIDKYKFNANRIYNVDESGLSTVQRPQKILATTGRKQVGAITSAERGSNVTVVCCMNAAGSYVPPFMIFPRKNMKNELVDEAPTGTVGVAQENGWMSTEIFVKWLHHFQSFVKASHDDKVLLIVDGHASHKSFEALNFAKENGIEIVCLPPHCTHRMQPLDVCFYGPLKTYFNQEISVWLRNHPGRVVTAFQIGYLFNQAYGKTASVQNACNGFKGTGLWPVNPDIFPDHFFDPAETTNIPIASTADNLDQNQDDDLLPSLPIDLEAGEIMTQIQNEAPEPLLEPSTSSSNPSKPSDSSVAMVETNDIPDILTGHSDISQPSTCSFSITSPLAVPVNVISPVPRGKFVSGQGKRKPKKRTTTFLLTSSPNMVELKLKRAETEAKKPTRKRIQAITKSLYVNEDSDEDGLDQEVEEDDCACIYCNDLYSRSKPGEGWLRCMKCSHWVHAACADLPKRTKIFVCELCN